MDDMSTAALQIVYDGPALQTHEMEVRDLAPALLALGDLFEEANTTLNGKKAKVSVHVKGSFKTGCFGIDLSVTQSIFQQAQDFFAGNPVTAALNIVAILGLTKGSIAGVFQLVKWVRCREITAVEVLDNGKVKIFCDADLFETEQEVLALFGNWKLRKAFQDVVHPPLEKPGIDYFAVREPNQPDFAVATRSDASAFIAPSQEEETIEETTREVSLQLVNVAFRDDHKWRFSDGQSTFHAAILDEAFLSRVESNEEHFSKGDILRVKLTEKKKLVGPNLKNEYRITEVLSHRSSGTQLRLPINRTKD